MLAPQPIKPNMKNQIKPLFSFGTLQDPDVFSIVSGGSKVTDFELEQGWIENVAAMGVLDGLYPVMQSSPGNVTYGTLFHLLPQNVLDRLIWFEWPEFTLAETHVTTGAGIIVCNYFKPAKIPPISAASWTLEEWQGRKKQDWITHARLAMHFYGTAEAPDVEKYWPNILAYIAGGSADLPISFKVICDRLKNGGITSK